MFSAEGEFCLKMKALWAGVPPVVNCTVGFPDERWVNDLACPKACVFADDLQLDSKVSDPSATRLVAGGGQPGDPDQIEYRFAGEGKLVLEVRLRTDNNESQLNTLTMQFLTAFQAGYCFGPAGQLDAFQIMGQVRSVKVRGPEGGPRITERLFRVPIEGPLEESSEKYEVETVEDTLEVGA